MRSRFSILLILLLAAAIHVDLHVGRPADNHWSFGLTWHWLLAIPVFAWIAWYAARRWRGAALSAGPLNIAAGVLLGQIVEPLLEAPIFRVPVLSVWGPLRWTLFTEFMTAGLLTYIMLLPLALAFALNEPGARKPE